MTAAPRRTARLVLEDGTIFRGSSAGAEGTVFGELVFNTSHTGYQEILTDPSYHGQIVTLTCPLIGNYGTLAEEDESWRSWATGLVIREAPPATFTRRDRPSLREYLQQRGIPAIAGIDTRALTKRLRSGGVLRAALSTEGAPDAELLERVRSSPSMDGRDLAREVSCTEPQDWTGELAPLAPQRDMLGLDRYATGQEGLAGDSLPGVGLHVVAVDFGVKHTSLRILKSLGCRVSRVPGTWGAERILALEPDGVFLSNGPGDPAATGYGIECARALLGKVPIFGICLGHQLLGLACGATTSKLPFGHRGANHPVKRLSDGKVEISSQNHGFVVNADSLPPEVEATHINLNDGTLAGLRHKVHPAFGVQYHPEAAPGPADSLYLFLDFVASMRGARV